VSDTGKLTHEALDYKIRVAVTEHLRPRRLKNVGTLIDEIVWTIMEKAIPDGAFEENLAHQEGFLFFHGEVEENSCTEMQHELLSAHLTLKKGHPITMFLTSPGGSLSSGLGVMGIMNKIQREGRPVNVHIMGEASSMGTIITQAATRRLIDSTAIFMIHEYRDEFYGKYREFKDYMEGGDKMMAVINNIYAERTGKPAEYWADRYKRREVYLTAQEAFDENLVDEVVKSPYS
jgi:ATP-dependent protease ClpP protease subunit